MRPPRINVTIERIVLSGVAPDQRDALLAALTGELRRQLAANGARQALGASRNVAKLRAQPLRIGYDAGGTTLGRQIGRNLSGALKS